MTKDEKIKIILAAVSNAIQDGNCSVYITAGDNIRVSIVPYQRDSGAPSTPDDNDDAMPELVYDPAKSPA